MLRYGDLRNIKLIRLGRKDKGKWERTVHEFWNLNGKLEELKYPLLHYPHQNVAQFLEKVRQYSLMHAQALEQEGVKGRLWQIIIYPLGKFTFNYFLNLGFLDGTAGFVHAMMMSLHSFLARSQLWLKQRSSNR